MLENIKNKYIRKYNNEKGIYSMILYMISEINVIVEYKKYL